jgi:hypothetical protein
VLEIFFVVTLLNSSAGFSLSTLMARFSSPQAQFSNMSRLIEYVNANPELYGIQIQYSTAKEYFDALYAETALSFPLVQGMDFEYGWPHVAGDYNSTVTYQTGATTSWQAYKQYVRSAGGLARSAEATFALANIQRNRMSAVANSTEYGLSIDTIRQFRALVQHHDSVPGTMRTNVSCNASFWIGV